MSNSQPINKWYDGLAVLESLISLSLQSSWQSAREKSNIGAGYQDLASLQGDNPRLIDIMDHSHAGQTVPCQTVKTALEVLGLMRKKPATVPCEAFLVTTENLFDGGVIKPLHVITCFHFSTYYLSLSLYLPAATPEHPPAASSPPLFSVGCEHWCHGQSTTQDLFQVIESSSSLICEAQLFLAVTRETKKNRKKLA